MGLSSARKVALEFNLVSGSRTAGDDANDGVDGS
jgi:hypothetical protein